MKKVLLSLAVFFLAISVVNISAMDNIGGLLELFEQAKENQQEENQHVPEDIQEKVIEVLETAAQPVQEIEEVAAPEQGGQNIAQHSCNRKCLAITLVCGFACTTAALYMRKNYDTLTWNELYTILSECFENSYF